MNTAVIILYFHKRGKQIDIEIPLEISAKEFISALNETYKLGIDTENISKCYLKSENPIALLKGDKTLHEYGIHNGTVINF